MATSLVLHGATAIDAASATPDAWIAVDNEQILATGTGDSWTQNFGEARTVDVTGCSVIPGLVDMHTHGAMGHDWAAASEQDAAAILSAHRARGTTSMVGSIMTDTEERTVRALAAMRDLMATTDRVWGAHLEGPCLAVGRKGAHPGDLLRHPTPVIVDILLENADAIAQITIAPELYGALAAIERCAEAGIVVAIGHTEASAEVVAEAFKRGASLVTHAFNGMRGISARDIGPVGAALAQPHVTLEIIGDGVHVDPGIVALLFGAAPGRVALVSDSLPTLGLPDGTYHWAQHEVTVTDDSGTLTGTTTLAGSMFAVLQGVRTAVNAGVEAPAAVAAASVVPAAALGRDPLKHRLRQGALPDLVVVDNQWHVRHVIAGGTVVEA